MITPYQKPEDKDAKASNFWTNLAGKLGLKAPLVRQASASEEKTHRLSDGIQLHSARVEKAPANVSRTDKISSMADQAKISASLLERYSGVFHRATAELGQSERVKAADRLSRIEEDMAAFKDKLLGLGGGEKAMADLVGEVSAKADSLSGACVQLRGKVDALSMAQAQSIENAFLVLSDAKTEIDKIKGQSSEGAGLAMTMEMGAPMEGGADLEIGGDLPDMPLAPEGEEEEEAAPSAIAGYIPAFVKKAADAAYNDLRCIHTKLSLVDSMLNALVSELNVSDMLGPSPMAGAGMPPEGMPPMEEMPGEEKAPAPFGSTPDDDSEKDRSESGLTAGKSGRIKTAASGDPGDTEPGNTIYKDIGKCRDCVWFESDWTHETYRDKCKHCTHASLGGAIEHFWPKSQQVVMWMPQWSAPEAKKKAFVGTLGLTQTATKVSEAALNIASEILEYCEHTAVSLGSGLMEYFQDPVVAKSMPVIAGEVASEIMRQTGVEIAITASKAKEWGRKKVVLSARLRRSDIPADFPVQPLGPGENPPGKTTCGQCGLSWDDDKPTSWTPTPSGRCPYEYHHVYEEEVGEPQGMEEADEPKNPFGLGGSASANGEVIIACDPTLIQLAKGEKRKIKELREQLHGEKDAAKIKSINDAIDSLYSRMDSDKERRIKSKEQREEKRKKAQEAADKEPAKLPEPATASFKGTLCLAKKSDHEDGGMHDPADDMSHGLGRGQGHTKNFKVVAVSTNQNSFGLHGVIMIAEDGEAWKAAHGSLELPKQGDMLKIDLGAWGASGFEIPEKLPAPPADVIAQVWGKQASSAGRSL